MNRSTARRTTLKTSTSRWLSLLCGVVLLACIGTGLVLAWGGPPKMPPAHLRYVQLLCTAVSSKDVDQVARMNDLFRSLHEKRALTDSQWQAICQILDRAKVQQWDQAMAVCEKLKKAQSD